MVKIVLIAVLALLLILGIPTATQANSPPPPSLTWFTFKSLPGALDAVQLVGCEEAACQAPEVLAQHGECTLEGCLPEPEVPATTLICRGKTCLRNAGWDSNISDYPDHFRVVTQGGDRLWVSNVVAGNLLEDWGSQYWRATVTGSELVLAPDSSDRLRGNGTLFGQGLLLTLALEAVGLGVGLRRLQGDRALWRRTLISFGLMHLVTYPVVWNLTTALVPFQVVMDQVFGGVCVAIALLYAAALYPIRSAALWKIATGTGIFLPLSFFLGAIVALLFGYGKYTPSVMGMPYGLALGIAEVFITGYEAGFLAMLSRGRLSLKMAAWLSLGMNSLSLLGGLLIWHIWF